MDFSIALILSQDGIVNGAIYALLALALVLVFTVTRVILVPQGEFVTYGALTLASLVSQKVPGTVWLLLIAGLAAFLMDATALLRSRAAGERAMALARSGAVNVIYPLVVLGVARWLVPLGLPLMANVVLALMMVVPLGPMLYRIAYQPIAEASVLVLLIVSVGVHLAMTGLGLLFFGAEGSRTPPFVDHQFAWGPVTVSGQSVVVVSLSAALITALYFFFNRTLYGKALRATAVNRRGAQLMGISTALSGKLTFALASLIGALSGALIAPITTVYYDSGFLVSLKGFVAAIVGGLGSYPMAAAGALLVGLLESFSSFYASAFKEVIVFTLIIPVLLWRSITHPSVEEE